MTLLMFKLSENHMLDNELETLRAAEKEARVTSFSQIPSLPKLIHMLLMLLFFLS